MVAGDFGAQAASKRWEESGKAKAAQLFHAVQDGSIWRKA